MRVWSTGEQENRRWKRGRSTRAQRARGPQVRPDRLGVQTRVRLRLSAPDSRATSLALTTDRRARGVSKSHPLLLRLGVAEVQARRADAKVARVRQLRPPPSEGPSMAATVDCGICGIQSNSPPFISPSPFLAAAFAQLPDVCSGRDDAGGPCEHKHMRTSFDVRTDRVKLANHSLVDRVRTSGRLRRTTTWSERSSSVWSDSTRCS